MNLYLVIIVVVVVFMVLMRLIALYAGRAFDHNITGHFRALESLVEYDRLPRAWRAHITALAQKPNYERSAKRYLLTRLKKLRAFFASYPFIDAPETRALLLRQLDDIAQRWQRANISEILSETNTHITPQGEQDGEFGKHAVVT